MAASAATVRAGSASSPSSAAFIGGSMGGGSELGSSPMSASGVGTHSAASVTSAMPTSEAGIARCQSGSSSMQAATTATAARAHSR
jgi:hypothetical protein